MMTAILIGRAAGIISYYPRVMCCFNVTICAKIVYKEEQNYNNENPNRLPVIPKHVNTLSILSSFVMTGKVVTDYIYVYPTEATMLLLQPCLWPHAYPISMLMPEKRLTFRRRDLYGILLKKNICFLIRNMLKFVAGDSIHNDKVLSQVMAQHQTEGKIPEGTMKYFSPMPHFG